jgi:hypothetical protein
LGGRLLVKILRETGSARHGNPFIVFAISMRCLDLARVFRIVHLPARLVFPGLH